jgi:hypothetical protein
MCEIDYDGEYCEVWAEKTVRARKKHSCGACEGAIAPGENYLRGFSVYDDDVSTWKLCIACEADRKAFCDDHNLALCDASSFDHYLRECLVEDVAYDENDNEIPSKWAPMIAAMDARKAANA